MLVLRSLYVSVMADTLLLSLNNIKNKQKAPLSQVLLKFLELKKNFSWH